MDPPSANSTEGRAQRLKPHWLNMGQMHFGIDQTRSKLMLSQAVPYCEQKMQASEVLEEWRSKNLAW